MMHPQTFIGLNKYGVADYLGVAVEGGKYHLDQLDKYVKEYYPDTIIKGRKIDIVIVRHSIIAIIHHNKKYFQNYTLKKIGRIFNIDHSTVISAIKQVDHWIKRPDINPDRIKVYKEMERDFSNTFMKTAYSINQ